jgi:hypothetical protein
LCNLGAEQLKRFRAVLCDFMVLVFALFIDEYELWLGSGTFRQLAELLTHLLPDALLNGVLD